MTLPQSRDNLDARAGLLNSLPAPLPIVGDIPVVGSVLSGGTKSSSSPPPPDPIASTVGDIPVVGAVVSALPSVAASVVGDVPVVGPFVSGVTKSLPSVVGSIIPAITKAVPPVVNPVISPVTKAIPPLAPVVNPVISAVTKSLPSPSSPLPLLITSPTPPIPSHLSSIPVLPPPPSLSLPVPSLPLPVPSLPLPVPSPPLPIPSLPLPVPSLPLPVPSLPLPVHSLPLPVPSPVPSGPLFPPSPSIVGGDPSSPFASTPSPPTQNGPPLGIPQPSSDTVAGGSILTPAGNITPSSISISNGANPSFTSTSFSGIEAPVVNVANVASNSLPETIQSGVASSSVSSSDPGSSGGPSSMGTNTNHNPSALGNSHHQLSSGAIAAIITVVLFVIIVLPVTIFILRYRSKKRRDEYKAKWCFATSRPSQPYGDIANEQVIPAGTQTARSSFVTTIDHSELGHLTHAVPPLPLATAEIGRGNASRPALVINTFNERNEKEENRSSVASAGSDRSQYLIVPDRNSTNPDPLANTPMSVRPFSPSESFAFPKPPEPAGSGPASVSGTSQRTRSQRSATSAGAISDPPGLPSLPTFTPLIVPHTIKPPSPMPAPIDPFKDNNPFDDPSTTPVINGSGDSDIQVVHRPFVPTLPDELNVVLDDCVRVMHRFDDGWGLVERIERDGQGERNGEMGLIPMACLRKRDEEFEPGCGLDNEGPFAF